MVNHYSGLQFPESLVFTSSSSYGSPDTVPLFTLIVPSYILLSCCCEIISVLYCMRADVPVLQCCVLTSALLSSLTLSRLIAAPAQRHTSASSCQPPTITFIYLFFWWAFLLEPHVCFTGCWCFLTRWNGALNMRRRQSVWGGSTFRVLGLLMELKGPSDWLQDLPSKSPVMWCVDVLQPLASALLWKCQYGEFRAAFWAELPSSSLRSRHVSLIPDMWGLSGLCSA